MYFADSLSSVVNPEWFISDLDPKQIAPDPGKKSSLSGFTTPSRRYPFILVLTL